MRTFGKISVQNQWMTLENDYESCSLFVKKLAIIKH